MNKLTRKELESIIDELRSHQETLSALGDEEQDKADNMPDNLQMSERHDQYEETAEKLQDAASGLDDVIDLIQEAIDL